MFDLSIKKMTLGAALVFSLGFVSFASAQSQKVEGTLTITPNSVTTADDVTFTWNTNAPEGSIIYITYVPTVWNSLMNIGYPARPLAPSGSITVPASQLTKYYLWYYPEITYFDFTARLVYASESKKRSQSGILAVAKFNVTVVP